MGDDKKKNIDVIADFEDYTFVALAMAFTPEADKELKRIGMRPIPGAEAAVAAPNKMKMYKEAIPLQRLTTDLEDMNKAFRDLYMQKSKPAAPGSPAPKPAPKPAPSKKTSP